MKATLLSECFKHTKDPIPNIENYYALYIAIVKNVSTVEALRKMKLKKEV